jgi:Pentapeptide repeats (8 copies)
MANPEHLKILQQGVEAWNEWRRAQGPSIDPDLRGADLHGADLAEANLWRADLAEADLSGAVLIGSNLCGANLIANLSGADLSMADLEGACLIAANLSKAKLVEAGLMRANLIGATLKDANMSGANLLGANFTGADLSGADLTGATLRFANLVDSNLTDAFVTGCDVYGVSAWNVKVSEGTRQQNLVITAPEEPEVTVDDVEVAQFVYLLLHNEKIREIIDTIGRKGVLLLGRFTEDRIDVLERLRTELRKRGYVPIVFNFDKPETKDFTETVRLLAGLSKFVIADVTNPKSAPLELQATVPEIMVPFRPIIEEGEKPFSMLQDLWIKHRDWVFEPIYYSSIDGLIGALDEKIIHPAEVRFAELLARKAEKMKGEHV